MFPRSAHFSLRLTRLLALAFAPACSVYDPSMLAGDEMSSAAATSAGGQFVDPAGSGGSTAIAGTSGRTGTTGSAGSMANGGTGSAVGNGGSTNVAGTGSGGNANGGASGAGSSSGSSSLGGMSAGGSGAGGAAAGGSGAGGAHAGGSGSAAGSTGNAGAAGSTSPPGPDPCSRSNWKASASESSLTMTPPQLYNPPSQAVDGDGTTRWSSGAAQVGGEWFLIDLGAVAPHLSQLVLDTSVHPTDYPTTYKLEVSSDNSTYTFVTSGSGSSMTTMKFSDHSARYLKITQTGTSTAWWSIHEISLSCQSN
jgi:hypothetical protein